jgi:hypothetical protein
LARDPQPTQGANVDIRNATALSWTAGDNAAQHDVYLGMDENAVNAAGSGLIRMLSTIAWEVVSS